MTTGTDQPVQVFVRLPHSWCGASLDATVRVAEAAERLGFDGVSVQDHVLASHEVAPCGHAHHGDDRVVMEPLATLAYIAARTSRVRLLTGVLVLPFRHLIWVAKTGATIDVLSNGRLNLGFGVGAPPNRQTDGVQNMGSHADISRRETALFNLPGPRGRLMDEALEALDLLWTRDSASFSGSMIQFEDVDLYPKPVQRPHPPLVIGTSGERVGLRIAARHAQTWNMARATPDEFGKKSALLDAYCREIGRDPAEIERSIQFLPDAMTGDVVARGREFIAAGATHLIFSCPTPYSAAGARSVWDDVVAKLRA